MLSLRIYLIKCDSQINTWTVRAQKYFSESINQEMEETPGRNTIASNKRSIRNSKHFDVA